MRSLRYLVGLPLTALALTISGCTSMPPSNAKPNAPPQSAGAAGKLPADNPVNQLLSPWAGPHGGVPPWDAASIPALRSAFDKGFELYSKELLAIANNAAEPTFENTYEAIERSGRPLDRVATVFHVMTSNRNSPEYQELDRDITPRLAEADDELYFNKQLFRRMEAVKKAADEGAIDLNDEQKRVVEKRYNDFIRRGAKLTEPQKKQLGLLNKQLATLFTDFSNKVLADEDTWVLFTDKELSGLPEPLVKSYAAAAKERKKEGYAVVNTRSAVEPFLTFSEDRKLREKVWRAFTSRGDNGNENDTNKLIVEIVKLRAERAKLLGYESHAHWRMSDTMARDPKRAMELMMRVWPAARARAQEEVRDMQKLADKEKAGIKIEPWDYRFYMEKLRKERYDLDQNEFKAYFELNNMIEASYFMAEKLYGYAFEEITGQVPVFHPDVRVYRVTNKSDGSHVGFLYRDDFARQYKRSGAWQATYQGVEKMDGEEVHAIVSNNNNFTKGDAKEPVLISLSDAETLFHEFGHALHMLTMDVTYPRLRSTPRDFVEFPSQVHENWVLTREVLDKYARHYKTNEVMPQELIDKLNKSATFNQGFATVEYLSSALVDMKLHTDPNGQVDPKAFEKKVMAEIGMPKEIVMRHRMPHFNHLFSTDSYSAGYYSYLWSDVMAADAWKAFEEKNDPWDPELSEKFAKVILATGDAIERDEAFRQFRGRDPKVEALLENRGFPTK